MRANNIRHMGRIRSLSSRLKIQPTKKILVKGLKKVDGNDHLHILINHYIYRHSMNGMV